MHFLNILVICGAIGAVCGFFSHVMEKQDTKTIVAVSAIICGAFAYFACDSASAIPADAEAFHKPRVEYRYCRPMTQMEEWQGNADPLPPGCVLPLPLRPATVDDTQHRHQQPSTDYHYVKPVNPFAKFASSDNI